MDHISIGVLDVARTKSFYERLLEPLGWACSGFRAGVFAGFKKSGSPALYFKQSSSISPAHLAFKAATPEQVAAFHRAALAAGGVDNGAPGPRPGSGSEYYAAFAFDLDGHNVEAVVGGVG
jgi:catechol 2,3-dioxygenase-like lactoylglutathione lyase family enzyme